MSTPMPRPATGWRRLIVFLLATPLLLGACRNAPPPSEASSTVSGMARPVQGRPGEIAETGTGTGTPADAGKPTEQDPAEPSPSGPPGSTPCGPEDGPEQLCDSATEICVKWGPFGPHTTYSCEPVPAGCQEDRTCACVAGTVCQSPYHSYTCRDVAAANAVSCVTPYQ